MGSLIRYSKGDDLKRVSRVQVQGQLEKTFNIKG